MLCNHFLADVFLSSVSSGVNSRVSLFKQLSFHLDNTMHEELDLLPSWLVHYEKKVELQDFSLTTKYCKNWVMDIFCETILSKTWERWKLED